MRPSVLLVCPGLDHAHRGFETFARECFDALRGRSDVEIELVKATGDRRPRESVVPTLTRETRTAQAFGRALSREPFVVEHGVFVLALIPLLVRRRPDVIYFSEWHVGRLLAAWRRASRSSSALVFCNGALAASGYGHFDRVQQLVPGAIEYAMAQGEPAERQELLPLGVAIESSPTLLTDTERAHLRERLRLPRDRRIMLAVGAINRQKRVDYLIEEIASVPEPRPFLLLVGQLEGESEALGALAQARLGPDGHEIRTVPPIAMADHYRAADAFVLGSLWESFGRVLVEAQSHGLPCLAHEYPVMNWVLGEEGETTDLREPGRVAAWLQGLSPTDLSEEVRRRRHRSAYERFSWDMLADRYARMLREVAEERHATTASSHHPA